MPASVRVVKVGGSLFALPDLGQRLSAWLAAEPAGLSLLIAGGGELGDVIRRADERHQLGDSAAHEMCLRLLSITARWLGAVVDQPIAARWEEIEHARSAAGGGEISQTIVFDPTEFLLRVEPKLPAPLPASWSVTSDSIAARITAVLEADQCVLLKSADPPPEGEFEELAAAGYVDEYFPTAVREVKSVRFVNLQAAGEAEASRRSMSPLRGSRSVP